MDSVVTSWTCHQACIAAINPCVRTHTRCAVRHSSCATCPTRPAPSIHPAVSSLCSRTGDRRCWRDQRSSCGGFFSAGLVHFGWENESASVTLAPERVGTERGAETRIGPWAEHGPGGASGLSGGAGVADFHPSARDQRHGRTLGLCCRIGAGRKEQARRSQGPAPALTCDVGALRVETYTYSNRHAAGGGTIIVRPAALAR